MTVFATNLVLRCIRADGKDEVGRQEACSGTPTRAFISTKVGDGSIGCLCPFMNIPSQAFY